MEAEAVGGPSTWNAFSTTEAWPAGSTRSGLYVSVTGIVVYVPLYHVYGWV